MKKYLYILILTLGICACNKQENQNESAIVEVNGEVLLKSELESAIPKNTDKNDSTRIAKEYIESWISHQLLLQKARLNVKNDDEIQALVNSYHEQLLIENYLRLLVERKAEIKPTEQQIESFYNKNKAHYILPENLIKGIFVVLPLDASNKDMLMQLIQKEEVDKPTIEAYCLQNAAKVDFFTEKWTAFRLIEQHLPVLSKTEEQLLKNKTLYETKDSLFQYILKIDEYKLQGDTAPLNYVHKELEEYLLNSNKVTYLQRLKKDLYNEAKRKGNIQYN